MDQFSDSPNITPLDFLWRFLNGTVYKTFVISLDGKKLIIIATENVTLQMLDSTWWDIENRFDTFVP